MMHNANAYWAVPCFPSRDHHATWTARETRREVVGSFAVSQGAWHSYLLGEGGFRRRGATVYGAGAGLGTSPGLARVASGLSNASARERTPAGHGGGCACRSSSPRRRGGRAEKPLLGAPDHVEQRRATRPAVRRLAHETVRPMVLVLIDANRSRHSARA